MSLNYKEIDLVLSELDLLGAKLQKVLQPSYDSLILEFYGPRGLVDLFISLGAGSCRIHAIKELPAKNERPLRFMECLRSNLRGASLTAFAQIGQERIIRMSLRQADLGEFTLYIRLWSGAGNIILVDSNGMIIDAMYRKPGRGEVSGKPCLVEESLTKNSAPRTDKEADKLEKLQVRDFPGEGSLSERIAAYYAAQGGSLSRESLLEKMEDQYAQKLLSLESRAKELDRLLEDYSNAERYRQIGDILMAGGFPSWPSAAEKGPAKKLVQAEDFYTGKSISIQVDPGLDAIGNARLYYEKAKKAASGLDDCKREKVKVDSSKASLEAWRAKLLQQTDPYVIAKALQRGGTVRTKALKPYPCLWIERRGWVFLVGRSAKENDELLRHHVRGSDLWLHARDYSGSYVFIKSRRDKSVPLDILLDAANLAVYYSKARKNNEGNVYYTQAKHPRRIKGETKGLVTPSMEKNLFVRLDEDKLREILSDTAEGEM